MTAYNDLSTPRAAPGNATDAAAQQVKDLAMISGGSSSGSTPSPYYSRLPATTTATPAPTPAATTPTIKPTADVPQLPAFNETDARNSAIAQAESQFSAITGLYDKRVADMTATEQKLGDKDLARANTISAMTGAMGGVDATSRAGGVERKTKEIIQQKTDAINAEKFAAISGVYSKIDANVQREKEIALNNSRADRAKLVDEMNRSASTNVMQFAAHGVDWNTAIKDPEFQAEVNRTGKSAFEVQTLYNNSLPKNLQPKELFSGFKGDNYVQIMQNADGTVTNHVSKASDLGIPKDAEVATITANDKVYWYDKNNPTDENGNLKITPIGSKNTAAAGKSAAATKPPIGAPTGVTADDIAAGREKLSNFASNGGYANPYLYRDMYDLWTQEGGDRSSFIKTFPPDKYLNPEHGTLKNDQTGEDVLPSYLRPKASAKSTSRSI